jgi:membrane protein DedA with SNARE-associated domain
MMHQFISYLDHISFVASFFAPMISGEMGVIFLAFISANGPIYLFTVIIWSAVGLITLDCVWFWALKHPWVEKRVTHRFKNFNYYVGLEKKIENFSHKYDVLTLFILKILVGSRVLMVIYMSARKVHFVKFFINNAIATFLWSLVIGYFGWFAGKGYYNFARTYRELTTIILATMVAVGVFYMIMYYVRQLIVKKENEI